MSRYSEKCILIEMLANKSWLVRICWCCNRSTAPVCFAISDNADINCTPHDTFDSAYRLKSGASCRSAFCGEGYIELILAAFHCSCYSCKTSLQTLLLNDTRNKPSSRCIDQSSVYLNAAISSRAPYGALA